MNGRQMKLWVILAAWFSAGACVFAGESITVKQYGITWTFDKPVQTGQFVDGDWWVVPAEGQDSVTVVKVDPAPVKTSEGKLINGSMVNPMSGFQAFDQRGRPMWGFQAFDQRGPLWKGEAGASYPVTLKVNQSLGSAVCYTDETIDTHSLKTTFPRAVKYIAVLTCLSKPALPTEFRPPFAGTDKPIYDSAKLRRDLLPNLALPATLKEKDVPDLRKLANTRFSRPWIDWFVFFGGMHCDYESNYGREKTSDVGTAGLLLCLDKKVVGDKEPLLIGLVQTGIDLYGMLNSGCRWTSDGGWNMGRKFPILFAGLMLDDKGMLNIGKKYAPQSDTFQEDDQAFIVTKADVGRKLDCMIGGPVIAASRDTVSITFEYPAWKWRKWIGGCQGNHIKIVEGPGAGQVRFVTDSYPGGKSTKSNTPGSVLGTVAHTVRPAWDVVPEVGKSMVQVLGYREEDIGHASWGFKHGDCPPWDSPSWVGNYNQMNKSTWTGEVLATRMLGLKEAWNNEAVFMLVDDWVANTAPDGSFINEYSVAQRGWRIAQFGFSSAFFGPMWETYRSKYGDRPKEGAK
jgi:hypothetical protein